MIVQVTDTSKLKNLYEGWQESLIVSYLQGHMGMAYASDTYESAVIIVDVFCFFAGRVSEEVLRYHKNTFKGFYILTLQSDAWNPYVEQIYMSHTKTKRYAIKKEEDIFAKEHLWHCIQKIPNPYRLEMINKAHYAQIMQMQWSKDLCALFHEYRDYEAHGLGVVAIKDTEIVAGASSYAYYDDGIEIEIDTKKEHRRKGLALACGAKLILECRKRGWYPSWDAQNLGSVALAETLGYHFDYAYEVYEVHNVEMDDSKLNKGNVEVTI